MGGGTHHDLLAADQCWCSTCNEHPIIWNYGAAAARYVDIYMEAIRWDNAAKLYDQYSAKVSGCRPRHLLKDAQFGWQCGTPNDGVRS